MFSSLYGFKGRVGRGGWWFGQLIGLALIGVLFAMAVVLHGAGGAEDSNNDFLFVTMVAVCLVAIAVINICTTVKRYHDRGKSGRWYFVSLIPLIGGIWQLIECGFCSGDDGDNDYGPPPGSAQFMENHDRDISGMGRGNLARVDDEYIANYAQKLASVQMQQNIAANVDGQVTTGRAVFGNADYWQACRALQLLVWNSPSKLATVAE
jgi:uncharacterized membrane protein YhaH (DUF805 family)